MFLPSVHFQFIIQTNTEYNIIVVKHLLRLCNCEKALKVYDNVNKIINDRLSKNKSITITMVESRGDVTVLGSTTVFD